MRIPALTLIALIPYALASPILNLAPLHKAGKHIDDHYIVVLRKGVEHATLQTHLLQIEQSFTDSPQFISSDGESKTGGIKKVYTPTSSGHGYFGYAGSFSRETLDLIRSSPEVAYVEHDQVISVDFIPGNGITDDATQYPASQAELAPIYTPDIVHALSSPWGLARISHRNALTLGTLQRYDYSNHAVEEDKEVDVYVVDTGVNVAHVELQGRAVWGKTIPSGAMDKDGNGHGSHCAGTIASRKYGVAKGANVVAVKVLGDNGSGTLSDVIGGIEWAVNSADDKLQAYLAEVKKTNGKPKRAYKGAIISMSLGGGKSQATDDAVNAAVDAGVIVVVAAGNENRDCDTSSPARAKKVITVGASTLGDERAYFSNYGTGININAPGLNILSIWNTGNTSTNTISGTSMACPHVAGWAAYVLEIYGTETLPLKSQKELNALTILAGEAPTSAELDAEAQEDSIASLSLSSIISAAYHSLPAIAKSFIPASQFTFTWVAPAPKQPQEKLLTPNQIKGLIIKLATKDILGNLPEGTPNVLLYNNATEVAKGRK